MWRDALSPNKLVRMRGLFRFIGRSIAASAGRSIAAAVLILLGVTPEWIVEEIRSGLPGVPSYATGPVARLVLIILAFLLMAVVFYRGENRGSRPINSMTLEIG